MKRRGYDVELIHDSPTFCRLLITNRDDQLLIDLEIDSPPHDLPTVTVLGPTMGPRELAGRKLLALFGRAEARDFADAYVLAQRFGKDLLLGQAAELDAGFDRGVLGQMLGTIGRFTDDEIPLPGADVSAARAYFAAWASELQEYDG
ncbi:nucleotidyltransferase AbiEii toxin of type IV toxin-antitoxin system [Antricoccus suffuscus]|uniref:Nucleotidyltransferase AbiEii toxin of type IV toxin-antitoxin system n=1 Tax=Antricoccus suffuscus TaxID=1629062 RepID=A0A2T0ZWW1_9ACTN|nr:nucleotidyltransferase AbiEii toxin of type IV toxin-antitoxin system [Antricoccus suffuscus]